MQIDDELAKEGEGRRWNDHGSEWVGKEGKKDGFVSTLTQYPAGRQTAVGGAKQEDKHSGSRCKTDRWKRQRQ